MSETNEDSTAQSIEHVRALTALLASGYESRLIPQEHLEDGTLRASRFDYAPEIWVGIAAAKELLGADARYHEHIAAVRERGAAAASPSELGTWFTWMSRGERLCSGFMDANISAGNLAAISNRLVELIDSGEVPAAPGLSTGG